MVSSSAGVSQVQYCSISPPHKKKRIKKRNGWEGDGNNLYPLCVRLLAILPFFPFPVLEASAPSKP